MWKRLLLICTIGALIGIFVIPLNPVNSRLLKLAFLLCVAGFLAGVILLLWKRKPWRWVALAMPVVLIIPFVLPGRDIKADQLSEDYMSRVAAFEGTRYHWGGESSRGIDCSGLPRRALRDALLAQGFSKLNGRAFRAWLKQWWHDASAKALGAGYRGYTRSLGATGTIREMDYEGLVPGDLAVTTSGVHILVYMGDGRWAQADPGPGKVTILDGRTGDSGWFGQEVTTHRWRVLD